MLIWHDYFKSLLGDEPVVTGLEENIETVFESLDIPDGPFTMEEYQRVKRKINNGKAAGPDGIPPEVFKLTNIDVILLEFANNLQNNGPSIKFNLYLNLLTSAMLEIIEV